MVSSADSNEDEIKKKYKEYGTERLTSAKCGIRTDEIFFGSAETNGCIKGSWYDQREGELWRNILIAIAAGIGLHMLFHFG